MKIKFVWVNIVIVFISLLFAYYFIKIGEIDKTFLTISTFVFSIFTGFFISRQNSRYDKIREKLSQFDGNMSSIYRCLYHLSPDIQDEAGEIIKKHYSKTINNTSWYKHIVHESTTVKDLHALLELRLNGMKLTSLQSTSLTRVFFALHDIQLARKGFIASYQERLPRIQWLLIDGLATIILINISAISSQFLLITLVLKAAFGTAIILTLFLLRQLDNLELFEGAVGEDSALDVIDNIN